MDVTTRSWWHRTCVFQEAVVSKDLILKCGKDEVSWSHFDKFCHTLLFGDNTSFIDLPAVLSIEITSEISAARKAAIQRRTLPLSHLVAWNRRRYATDPRDLVFSIIYLSTDSLDSSVMNLDYSPSNQLLDVYVQFVKHAIGNSGLDIICMSRGTDKLDWPSWVPDWTTFLNLGNLTYEKIELVFMDSLISSFSTPEVFKGRRKSERSEPSEYTASSIWHLSTVFFMSLSHFAQQVLASTPFSPWRKSAGSRVRSGILVPSTHGKLWKRTRLAFQRFWNPIRGVAYVSGGTVAEAFCRTLTTGRLLPGSRLEDGFTG